MDVNGYKLKRINTKAFNDGLNEGVSRLFGRDSAMALRHYPYSKAGDINAFRYGYDLAFNSDYYFELYKQEKNLLFAAVSNGDVIPVDWKFVYVKESGRYYKE